jgi:hypothetical protein
MCLREESHFYPELGLGVDGPTHHRAGLPNLFVESVVNLYEAHAISDGEYMERVWIIYNSVNLDAALERPLTMETNGPSSGRSGSEPGNQREHEASELAHKRAPDAVRPSRGKYQRDQWYSISPHLNKKGNKIIGLNAEIATQPGSPHI